MEQLLTNEEDTLNLIQISTNLIRIAMGVKEFSLHVLESTKKRADFWTGPSQISA